MITLATDARADVGNPGYFEFTVPPGFDSAFWFATGAHMELSGGGRGYFWQRHQQKIAPSPQRVRRSRTID